MNKQFCVEGEQAFKDGKSFYDNPYEGVSIEKWVAWKAGWMQAEREHREPGVERARKLGKMAYHNGDHLRDNPYPADGRSAETLLLWKAWKLGWIESEREVKK